MAAWAAARNRKSFPADGIAADDEPAGIADYALGDDRIGAQFRHLVGFIRRGQGAQEVGAVARRAVHTDDVGPGYPVFGVAVAGFNGNQRVGGRALAFRLVLPAIGAGVVVIVVGGELRERHAQDLGVFRGEAAGGFAEVVGGAAQGAAGDLLAQQRGAELAKAQQMGNGAGVPALGEHPDGDDATDVFAGLSRLADGVHDPADDFLPAVLLGEAVGLMLAVSFGQRVDGFGQGSGNGLAILQAAVDDDGIGQSGGVVRRVFQQRCARVSVGDVLEHIVGIGDAVHYHGHHRDAAAGGRRGIRTAMTIAITGAGVLRVALAVFGVPFGVGAGIIPVKDAEGFFEQGIVAGVARVKAAPLARVGGGPDVPVARAGAVGFQSRHFGNLGQAGFDGVDQGIVGNNPFHRQRVFLGDVSGGGRQIGGVMQASGVAQVADSLKPHGVDRFGLAGVAAVAVMAFVVDDQYLAVVRGVQAGDAGDDFGRGFQPVGVLLRGDGLAAAVQQGFGFAGGAPAGILGL